jgi:hypothetical protein
MDMTERILSVNEQEKGKSLLYLDSTTFCNIGSFRILSLSSASSFPCHFKKHPSARRFQRKSNTLSGNFPNFEILAR